MVNKVFKDLIGSTMEVYWWYVGEKCTSHGSSPTSRQSFRSP